ncbi:hypothetical protein BAE44_0007307 [Dichanthelium oligosanthes]|uniref:Methyl-CpG-binding domain-containing protein 8 n=1 Tax=Dichanthelium oligosanthes TaxID=888268 RepID=A0A1E5W2Q3_9POAL|nr:hypothetical protein BAE44_0007307 [Dichanthelium oligosanthes]
MATELLPVVDLRALAQSDLDSLAAASAHALAPRSCPDADPLPPLKIDRAVFNESAGSRKQTFSRLRLGTAASSSSPSARPTSAQPSTARNDPDSNLVAYQLRRLFVPDDPSLPPSSEPQTLALALTGPSSPSPPPDPDQETTNAKGISVDLVRLAGIADPYDAELQRRTAGMALETELQGFIASVAGKWASQRQRRKFVDASFFGDHLPRGWKLQLGLKRKGGTVWVHCFSYVSPKGNQFSTCKEVSAYLMSLLGYPEMKSVTNQYESTGQLYLCANSGDDNVSGFQDQIGSGVDKPNILPVASLTCQKCNLTFCDRTAYEQHHFSCHETSSKRRRTGKFGEPLVGKDGKFECPICQKTFEEESRYFGHVGSHARYQGLTPEAFFDKVTSGRAINDSLAEVSFTIQELTGSPGLNNKVSGVEAGFRHQQGDNNSTVTELFSTNCSDNFIGPNKARSRPEEIPLITDFPSVCRYSSATGHAHITVTKGASNSSHQPVSNTNGFAGVTSFNGQLGSNHVARPTAFGTSNHYQDRIMDHGMVAPKHADNNTVKARDVNLNSSLDTISFPIASANNETSAALNEVNRSSFTANCISSSFNNNDGASSASSCSGSTNKISSSVDILNKTSVIASRGFDPSYGPYGHDYGALKANPFANKNMQLKNSGQELTSNTREQMHTVKNRTSKEAGFGTEAYNSGTFSGVITERGFAQFNNSFTHTKPNASSRCSLPESNTLGAGNFIKGSGGDVNYMKGALANRGDANFTKGPFVNRPINNNEPNVPVLECDLQLGFGAQKQQIFSSHGELRSAATGSPQLGSNARNNSLPTGSSQFGSMDGPKSFPIGTPQFGGFARPNSVSAVPSQLGSMARSNYVHCAESSQFASMVQANSIPPESTQFGRKGQPDSVPPASTSQFRSVAGPNSVPPAQSSQFGSMARPNPVPPESSQFFGNLSRPNSAAPAESSQFGSMARPNPVHPAISSQFGNMPIQNFVSTSEPTLVLGYAPQMGSAPPPPVQIGWDSSLPRMVTGGMVTCVCIWCNSQFHHFDPIDGRQAGSFGFICPACKDRMSGHHNMPNNGSWQP